MSEAEPAGLDQGGGKRADTATAQLQCGREWSQQYSPSKKRLPRERWGRSFLLAFFMMSLVSNRAGVSKLNFTSLAWRPHRECGRGSDMFNSFSWVWLSQKVLRLEETSEGHLVQPLCTSRATQSRLPRTISRWLLSVSQGWRYKAIKAELCQWHPRANQLSSSYQAACKRYIHVVSCMQYRPIVPTLS